MKNIVWENIFNNEIFIKANLSSPRRKKDSYRKIDIQKIIKDKKVIYQIAQYSEKQVFHKNLSQEELIIFYEQALKNDYKQGLVQCSGVDYQLFSNSKGEITYKKITTNKEICCETTHNRKKNSLIEENKFIPFLYELGVMSKDGKIIQAKYAKFRQINRFLEFIQDVVPSLPKNQTIHIVDFGCGKSYLTFATHYYLQEVLGLNVEIIGLDLKEDVIKTCNSIVEKYDMKNIKFFVGNIENYVSKTPIDMVITLHACDTATDFALEKAIKWNAKVILSVPCCQHEVHYQMKCSNLSLFEDYGLIQERLSSLITDVTRAEILKLNGYKVQILEFIDMEHTPKNILIRAVLNPAYKYSDTTKLDKMKKEFNYELTLEKLLKNK